MGLINELWIIYQGGFLLYNQRIEETMNPVLFSGLLNTIVSFAENLNTGTTVHKLELGDSNFVIVKETEFPVIFVGKSDHHIKEKAVKKILFKIKDKFIDSYRLILTNWNGKGNAEDFMDFSNQIDLATDEDNLVEKFKKMKW